MKSTLTAQASGMATGNTLIMHAIRCTCRSADATPLGMAKTEVDIQEDSYYSNVIIGFQIYLSSVLQFFTKSLKTAIARAVLV